MATRLATQRNFVSITPTSCSSNDSNGTHNNAATSAEDIITITPSETTDHNTDEDDIQISHIMSQKKLILQTGSSGVSVIDVVPIDVSDSGDESSVTLSGLPSANDSTIVETLDDSSSGGTQQVTAQVAVVESQSPNDPSSGPHYITVTVASNDNSGHDTYQVQYVDPEIYNTNNQNAGQISYPFCAVSDYPPNTQPYYSATGNYTTTNTPSHSTNLPYIVPVDENMLVAGSQSRDSPQSLTAEVTYVQGNNNTQQTPTSTTSSNTESDNTPGLSHATRISPATVAWLLENYETAEGVSLPRSTLYNHYMRHCNENKLDAVNAASFGKLIRSVFNGLRTRRLGTRGNSKYHYYGIRIKPGSSLMHAIDDKPQNSNASGNGSNATSSKALKKMGGKPETFEACLQYLGVGTAAIPMFPNISIDQCLGDEITLDDVDAFRSIYREHCELFLDAILNLEFSSVESLWRDFWRATDNNNLDDSEEEKYLTKSKLYALCKSESVQSFIKEVDYNFYQNMVDVLIPDVLRPIPSSLTQAIRNFAKNLENWLTDAMSGCPQKVTQIKIAAVSAFSQTLRRYTSLNHLAQAARAVLQNSSQIAQMLNDLNRVDFNNVQEQASWVCQCDTATVQRLENDFKTALQRQNTLEQWAAWLRLVVDSALEEYRGKPNYAKAARQFLLKWSFYSSMVIRDLTLRSAASFGSFHLIRLLYDEYMFFLVEHKVAQARHTTPIAVMTEVDKVNTMKTRESAVIEIKEKFLSENPSIDESTKLLTDSCDIDSDDEVWLLQCPESINIDAIINRKIKLPGKSHHEHIESVAEQFPSEISMTLGIRTNRGYNIKNVPVAGHVFIRERLTGHNQVKIEPEPIPDKYLLSKTMEKFPSIKGLKVRHPLLGANYEDKIKLDPAIVALLKKAKRARKHKNRRATEGNTSDLNTPSHHKDSTSESLPSVKVKKEKIKKPDIEEVVEIGDEPKVKKIKKENVDNLDLEWIKRF